MSLLDVTRFNDTVPGLKTFQDDTGDVLMAYTPPGAKDPVMSVNFSNAARHVLALFGLKEPPVEKYGVEDRSDLWKKEITQIDADIKTIEANGSGLTKEASGRLQDLRTRRDQVSEAMRSTEEKH